MHENAVPYNGALLGATTTRYYGMKLHAPLKAFYINSMYIIRVVPGI